MTKFRKVTAADLFGTPEKKLSYSTNNYSNQKVKKNQGEYGAKKFIKP